ncbi:basic leucine zipper transcriptional factor ATF-like 2 [Esox lucius]|uniref:basic leucine zipper transcriptional factor ATF-like 2 n=1 Tax=Esox lucius TaxID=8010 RepID=UPI001476D0F3|nr:basic leucine zipper transcriptional factor ATF-like 2 [Esox lucius]XP_019898655.2 basic leucine zipper transcriptional factor ATF-like 2 [Esox lucius]XP_019898656.2 basic leucine zipper transcriptional factor ATF-like 2 [Esox lucius]
MVFLLTDMSPEGSFMDSRSECSGASISGEDCPRISFSASISGEDCPSPSESERGKKGRSVDQSGKKRAKNRDSARKSRKKQTERADILHQELQTLECCNSALEKEIAGLRREFQHYTVTLEQHQPLCRLGPCPIPQDAPSCPILPLSNKNIFPVTTPGPSKSQQSTKGSLITETGGQRTYSPAPSPTLSLVSAFTNIPSATHVTNTNPYPILSSLITSGSSIAPTTTVESFLATQTTSNHLSPITDTGPHLASSTLSSLPMTCQVTQYPLTLLTSANEHPVELSLSDILDSPDWLCAPESTTWCRF